MKTFKVTITGIQAHIKGDVFTNCTENDVLLILDKYHDIDYPMPKFDGQSYELNGDKYIRIEEEPLEYEDILFHFSSRHSKSDGWAKVVDSYKDGEIKAIEQFKEWEIEGEVKVNKIGTYNLYDIYECYVDSGSEDYFYFAIKRITINPTYFSRWMNLVNNFV